MWLEYVEQYLDRVFPRFLSEKPWNYKDDLCMVGAEDLYCATGSESWREPVRRNASFLMDDAGRVANWVPGEHNIDKVSFGKSMGILRDVTGEARWAEGVERAYRILADYPRTVTGNFWHKDIYPDQVWLDGLYMGMPFYAACLTENGEDNWDDILDQFTSAHKLLWDEQLGLYRHANDCSRKMEWADPVTGQSPVVWLRAEGWFLMALADTYEIAKDRTPRAGELCPLLKNALDRLLPYQVADTGMFLQVVDRADLTGNYSETSGSAMVAYALMKGARLGMLPPEYGEKGSRVLDGIRDGSLQYDFVEFMACPGGCINGGGQPIQHANVRNFTDIKALRAAALYKQDEGMTYRRSHENPVVQKVYADFLGEPGGHKAHALLHCSYIKQKRYRV